MIFKKIFLFIFLFCIFFNFSFAEIKKEPYENDIFLSVSSFSINKTTYNLGEKVKGNFFLINERNQSVSNVRYSIFLKGGYNKQMGYFEKVYDVQSYHNIFLGGLEKKNISFEYNIPDIDINGEFVIEIKVFSDSGFPLSKYTKKIKINGNDGLFNIIDSYVDIDNQKFPLQAGPSIRENREGSIRLKISDVKEDIIIFPKIKIFDRSITGELLKEENRENLTLRSDVDNDIKINFTDIIKTPGVYEAELVLLDKNDKQLSEKIFFRYIVYGDIVTIQNVNTDSKEFNKGDVLNLNIYYTGSPYDLTTGETPKQSTKKTNIILKNYFGIEVSNVSLNIDYSGEGKIIIPMILKKTAGFLSADIKIYNDNDQVLIGYKVDLSSRKNFDLYLNIVIVLLVFLSFVSFLFIGRNKKIFTFMLIIFFLFSYKNSFAKTFFDLIYFSKDVVPTLTNLEIVDKTTGSTIEDRGEYTDNGTTLKTIKVKPGTKFTVEVTAVLNSCTNARIAEVYFDNVGETNIRKYNHKNDLSSADDGEWPKGDGSGKIIIGDDNRIKEYFMDYFTAPMTVGVYKIPLEINTYEYTDEIENLTSGPGYMYVQVYEDGVCGDANGKTYGASDTTYSPYKQCSTGSSSNTSFPNPGATSTWTCLGNNGGSDSPTCSASRSVASLNPEIIYFEATNPIVRNSTTTLSWNSVNTNNCSLIVPNVSNLGVSTTTYKRYITASPGTYSYTLKCFNATASTTKNALFQVVETLPPTLTLTGDSTVLSGTSPTLSWSATNVKNCTKNAGWSGDISIINNSTSGTEEPGAITANTTYDISCIGLNDSPISATVNVKVVQCDETRECPDSWSECVNNSQSRTCNISYSSPDCGEGYEEVEYKTPCGNVEVSPLSINCQAYQNFGSGSSYASREASTGTIYVNRDMDWRLFINDPNENDSYTIESPQGRLLERDGYYYLSKLYQNSGLKIFNAKVTGVGVGGEGACATSVNAVIGGQIIIEE